MRKILPTAKYKEDIKRLFKQGINLAELDAVVLLLREDSEIPRKHNDHQLKGNLKNYRDLHIRGNWLLLYRKENENLLHLIRTGSHAEIFGN